MFDILNKIKRNIWQLFLYYNTLQVIVTSRGLRLFSIDSLNALFKIHIIPHWLHVHQQGAALATFDYCATQTTNVIETLTLVIHCVKQKHISSANL